jgi:hypothetical protein
MDRRPIRDGSRRWWKTSDEFHRWAGPSVEYDNGRKEWWWHGSPIYTEYRRSCVKWFLGKPNKSRHRFFTPATNYGKGNFWAPGYSLPPKEER